jgi:hypothetical protein
MKKYLVSLILGALILSLPACSKDNADSESSEGVNSLSTSSSADVVSDESENTDGGSSDESVEFVSESPEPDKNELIEFPDKKIDSSFVEDGNFYLRVQTVRGDETWIREIAIKGKDAYSSTKTKDAFVWYYSNGETTFVFDDENKVYEVYDFRPLEAKFFFDGEKLEEGSCVFFDVKSKYVKYSIDDKNSIMHFYRESDGSWLGFQYMYEDQYKEVNKVLDVSDEYPSHVKFAIPDDYEFYFHHGDNEASINWD